jgi:tape measure domain-containing protein
MTTISIGTLRYDIISDTTRFVKGIKATARQKKEADRIFREGLTPMQKHNFALIRMYSLYKKGMITKEQVLAQQVKIKATLRQEQQALRMAGMQVEKYRGSYAKASVGLAGYTASLNRNTKAILRNKAAGGMGGGGGGGSMRGAANGNRWANFGGSLGSAAGFGGAGAGAGRIAGMGSGVMIGLGAAVLTMGKVIRETALLETALVDMQVIMGDDRAGTALVNNLRSIARETPLTSKALIKGAQTLLGYGLSAEGLEDTMYRIGEIAGGDTARMDSLTRAFAQVQSAGKLMGQEMLQLVNAGFPVAEIAKAAGVSMEDFRKEMEEGNIKASHLTEAMVNLTSAGGMMEGRLARQADTLKGKWITAMGAIDQKFAEVGESSKEKWKDTVQFLGEFSVNAIQSFDDITTAVNEVFTAFGELTGVVGESGVALDEHGKKLSGYESTVRGLSDQLLRIFGGYSQDEIDSYRAGNRRIQMLDDEAKKRKEERQRFLDGRKKIKEATDKEVSDFKKAQEEKAKAIYDEMKPEEDLAAMRARHQKERYAAMREGTRLRANSGNQAAQEYYQSVVKLQQAEEAKLQKKMADERFKAQYSRAKDLEQRRFDFEKENIKKAVKIRENAIKDQEEASKRNAKAIGDRGKYTAMDTYTASAQIEAEYRQNQIVNTASDRREQQLEDLKNLERDAERKAEQRHQQRMKVLDQSYNNGKP